ncbi:MAG: HNH endonuclease [Candidatus Limnocylindrus sp.]
MHLHVTAEGNRKHTHQMAWPTTSSTARGYGYAWQQKRRVVMANAGGLCAECRRHGRLTPATDVDHIKRKADGGTDELGNLQALCKDCHEAKTMAESGCVQRPQVGTDGWPVGRGV